jgi:hypothetical protein
VEADLFFCQKNREGEGESEGPYIFGVLVPEQKPRKTERSRGKTDGSGGAAEADFGRTRYNKRGAHDRGSDGGDNFGRRGRHSWPRSRAPLSGLMPHTPRFPFFKYEYDIDSSHSQIDLI